MFDDGDITEEVYYRNMEIIPYLLPENHFVWEIYNRVRNQLIIAGMGEPIGINYLAVQIIFDCYDVQKYERLYLLEFIDYIFYEERRIMKKFEPPPSSNSKVR